MIVLDMAHGGNSFTQSMCSFTVKLNTGLIRWRECWGRKCTCPLPYWAPTQCPVPSVGEEGCQGPSRHWWTTGRSRWDPSHQAVLFDCSRNSEKNRSLTFFYSKQSSRCSTSVPDTSWETRYIFKNLHLLFLRKILLF